MEIYLHLVNFSLGLDACPPLWTQLSLLCEEVLEENGNRRFHLLKDVLVDDLFGDFVASVTSASTARDSSQIGYFSQDFFDFLEDDLRLFAEKALERIEAMPLGLSIILDSVVLTI